MFVIRVTYPGGHVGQSSALPSYASSAKRASASFFCAGSIAASNRSSDRPCSLSSWLAVSPTSLRTASIPLTHRAQGVSILAPGLGCPRRL